MLTTLSSLWRGKYYNITEYGDNTPTADTVLFDVAKHHNGATDEVITACSMRLGAFQDLSCALASPF